MSVLKASACAPVDDCPVTTDFVSAVAYVQNLIVIFPVDRATFRYTPDFGETLQALTFDPCRSRVRDTASKCRCVNTVIIWRQGDVGELRTEYVDGLCANGSVTGSIACSPFTRDHFGQTACTIALRFAVDVRQGNVRAVLHYRSTSACRNDVRSSTGRDSSNAVRERNRSSCNEGDGYCSIASIATNCVSDRNSPVTVKVTGVQLRQATEGLVSTGDSGVITASAVELSVCVGSAVIESNFEAVTSATTVTRTVEYNRLCTARVSYCHRQVTYPSVVGRDTHSYFEHRSSAYVNRDRSSSSTYVDDADAGRSEAYRSKRANSARSRRVVARNSYSRARKHRCKFVFDFNCTPAFVAGSRVSNANLVGFAYVACTYSRGQPWAVTKRSRFVEFNDVVVVATVWATFQNLVSTDSSCAVFVERNIYVVVADQRSDRVSVLVNYNVEAAALNNSAGNRVAQFEAVGSGTNREFLTAGQTGSLNECRRNRLGSCTVYDLDHVDEAEAQGAIACRCSDTGSRASDVARSSFAEVVTSNSEATGSSSAQLNYVVGTSRNNCRSNEVKRSECLTTYNCRVGLANKRHLCSIQRSSTNRTSISIHESLYCASKERSRGYRVNRELCWVAVCAPLAGRRESRAVKCVVNSGCVYVLSNRSRSLYQYVTVASVVYSIAVSLGALATSEVEGNVRRASEYTRNVNSVRDVDGKTGKGTSIGDRTVTSSEGPGTVHASRTQCRCHRGKGSVRRSHDTFIRREAENTIRTYSCSCSRTHVFSRCRSGIRESDGCTGEVIRSTAALASAVCSFSQTRAAHNTHNAAVWSNQLDSKVTDPGVGSVHINCDGVNGNVRAGRNTCNRSRFLRHRSQRAVVASVGNCDSCTGAGEGYCSRLSEKHLTETQ